MRVGFDLDGVVFDIGPPMIKYGCKFCRTLKHCDLTSCDAFNLHSYSTTELFGFSSEDDSDFWRLYHKIILLESPTNRHIKKIFSTILSSGDKVDLVTARDRGLLSITLERIFEDQLPFSSIIFNAGDKAAVCKKLNIDFMVDDFIKNIDACLKSEVKSFIAQHPYNANFTSDNSNFIASIPYDNLDTILQYLYK